MRKVVKESPGLNVRGKLRKVGNVFLTECEVFTHEDIKQTLSLPVRSSNIRCDFIFTGQSEKRLRALKPQEVLQKVHPEDTNIVANGIIEKYAKHPHDLENKCYANFTKGYVNFNTKGVVEDDDIKNYTIPASNHDEEKSEGKIIVLKNKLGKMRKRTQSHVMRYHKVSELEDPELPMILWQLYLSWRI